MLYKNRFSFLLSIPCMVAIMLLALSGISITANAQTADKVIAVVGKNRIILQSELENQMAQMAQQDATLNNDSTRCEILQQMIVAKLMVEQAERDSLLVSEEEVEATLENRVRYFISMYGSKEKLEQISGKTIYQLKDDNREIIRETMLSERMSGQIMSTVKVTPAEVTTFFNKIPADSLPFFPATVELGQIVIEPGVDPEIEALARKSLEDIRKKIVAGEISFETEAGIESEDPGSRDNGGDLGTMGRNDFVPEFSAAAFKLQNGEISQIVKTKFGFHIIQMVKRQGEQAHLRHILKRPQRTSQDYNKVLVKLDSVRAQLIAGTTTFQEAVGKYATDDMSKRTGGMVTDPQTGSSTMEVDKLDASLALMLDSLKPGAFSKPHIFDRGGGDKAGRIVYMKSITTPHKANLRDDYNRIQEAALNQKKAQRMEKWLAEKLPSFYLKIDPNYVNCSSMHMLQQAQTAKTR
ncbi:MAG: peptidylprolyl isomerase [Sphingobacteriales bacterium]|nr:MAG: peptidylprolyl isomerase [Sphingobacteriales bacterium]